MPPPAPDLLQLFIGEAEERIDRIVELAPTLGEDPAALDQIRRELHALKGASRMMGFEDISELCHRGEDLLAATDPARIPAGLTAIMDRLAREIQRIKEGEGGRAPARGGRRVPSGETGARPSGGAVESVRIPADRMDELSERAVRLRTLAVGAGGLIARLRDLSHYAERSVMDREPRQVLATLATSLRHVALELDAGQRRLLRGAERQLESLLRFQLQPLRPFLMRLARHGRELAGALGKKVELRVEGGEVELDRRILVAIEEAMIHLVRNAVDHGIEPEDVRIAAGKSAKGLVVLRAVQEGRMVHLTVTDDGGGIDTARVLEVARERGLLVPGQPEPRSPAEVFALLFHPGFSTTESASDISGRGVGLDAVAAGVQRIGGEVWIESAPRCGTTVHVRAPAARRGERVWVMRICSSLVAVPASAVLSFGQLPPGGPEGGGWTAVHEGREFPVYRLGAVVGEAASRPSVAVFLRTAGMALALAVDGVEGQEEVLLHPLPAVGGPNPVFDAVALLASGRPVPVLSPLLMGMIPARDVERIAEPVALKRIKVLLVDDSMVTREMLRRLLEDGGFSVAAASSAEEALAMLEGQEAECIVTDIEMPGMSGLDLARRLRKSERYGQIPIVVISTRNTQEDRLAGLDAGADAFIPKQGLDAQQLIRLIMRLSA